MRITILLIPSENKKKNRPAFPQAYCCTKPRNIPEHIDEIYQYIVDSSYKRGLDLQFYGVATQYREIKGLNVDGYGLHQE